MNDEKKVADIQKATMQNVVQNVLPDDLKTKFSMQQNGGVTPITPSAAPLTFGADGNVQGNKPTPEKLDPNLVQKPIRTFESDLAEALAKKQGSSASISIAESRRKEEESRKIEAMQVQRPPMQPMRPAAVAPTRATAIPGASISIPPEMGKVESDITSTIRNAVPPPAPKIIPQTPPPAPRPVPAAPAYAVNVPARTEAPKRHILKPLVLTFVSLAFIGGGLFVTYRLFEQSQASKPVAVVEPIVIPSLIPNDNQIIIPVDGLSGNPLVTKIYSEINKIQTLSGKNVEIKLTEGNTAVTGSQFVTKLGTNMPDVIERSLTDRWALGVYGEENNQKTTFLALTTDFFQNAFAGMLTWEENGMADDLALVLNFKDRARKDELTGSSTISSYFTIKGRFSDKVIRNRDVREFYGQDGSLLFLYSFINKETLVLTTTESAFMALIDRIEKDAYVR